mmetsp:Transcript_3901/g.6913  ORF Transcript_3901/g.6913 Transcript_3901/m.6913 type:complete len:218 (+) Transcript_3901:49-702(+)
MRSKVRYCISPKRIGRYAALFLGSSILIGRGTHSRTNFCHAAFLFQSHHRPPLCNSSLSRPSSSSSSSSSKIIPPLEASVEVLSKKQNQKSYSSSFHSSSITTLNAKPKRGSAVDSYQTVAVNCNSCRHRLFRYKKKNGTKSNLIKCYVERIVYDNHNDPGNENELEGQLDNFEELSKDSNHKWTCPKCGNGFGRSSLIHGLPAIKLVGGKTRMTKK